MITREDVPNHKLGISSLIIWPSAKKSLFYYALLLNLVHPLSKAMVTFYSDSKESNQWKERNNIHVSGIIGRILALWPSLSGGIPMNMLCYIAKGTSQM